MRKLRCPNPDPNATHPRALSGWGGIPDMVRLYIRTSEKVTHDKAGKEIPYYDQKIKRTWAAVGQMCPGCRWVELDEKETPDGDR